MYLFFSLPFSLAFLSNPRRRWRIFAAVYRPVTHKPLIPGAVNLDGIGIVRTLSPRPNLGTAREIPYTYLLLFPVWVFKIGISQFSNNDVNRGGNSFIYEWSGSDGRGMGW